MEKAMNLIVLSNLTVNNDCQYDRLALDLENMELIHIRIDAYEVGNVEDIHFRNYPIHIAANLEFSYKDILIAHCIRTQEPYTAREIRRILAVKAAYPYRFLDGRFHLQYGLGKLHFFSGLSWIENRLWMKDAVISGTDTNRTVPVMLDDWKEMVYDHHRNELENRLHDWANDVFCVMVRRNVNRDTYYFRNILVLSKSVES